MIALLFLIYPAQADHDPEKIKQEVLKLLTKSQKEALVSKLFDNAEKVSENKKIELQTRNKRLLGVEIQHSFNELLQRRTVHPLYVALGALYVMIKRGQRWKEQSPIGSFRHRNKMKSKYLNCLE